MKEEEKIPIMKSLNLNTKVNIYINRIIADYVCIDHLKHNDHFICVPIIKKYCKEFESIDDKIDEKRKEKKKIKFMEIYDYYIENLYFVYLHPKLYQTCVKKINEPDIKKYLSESEYNIYSQYLN